jgi:beta-N-acetylhexosaminidase
MKTSPTLALLFLLFGLPGASAQQTDSLDIKIGQMLLIGFPSTKVDSEVLQEIKEGKIGSIIIFEKNIPPANSFVALKKIIWTYQKSASIPLFIAIDQEGGRVNRLKNKYGFPSSITASAMAKSTSLDSVQFYAEATAATLAGLGININFAPVVDLATNPDNPIIARYGRAFSANEDSVTMMAKEYIRQHHKHGVLTALKHFPGHGSSRDDTHLGIADVTNTWEERELEPYRILIDSGYTDAVMTSHIVNKKIEPDGHPGTLSDDVITGILRKRLKFNGVIFTDDMQMHAIAKHYGLEESIKLAINAGVDIMTFSNNISGSDQRTVDKVHSIIRKMVEDGTIDRKRIDQSFKRIMTLKRQLQMNADRELLKKAYSENEARLAMLEEQLKDAQAQLASKGKKKKKKSRKKA